MSKLVRVGNAAFDLDRIMAVEGTRVVFTDGREIHVSRKAVEGLLAVLPEWKGTRRDAASPTPALQREGEK